MPSTAFSIELDVNTTDTSNVHALFSYATGGYPNDNEILLLNQQNLQVWIGNVAVSTGLNVADGNDHRITVTWDSAKIGRASCGERGWYVRVDHGGGGTSKTTKKKDNR